VRASKPVPATVRSGRLGWLPPFEKRAAEETFDTIDGRLQKFSIKKKEPEVTRSTTRTAEHRRRQSANTTTNQTINQLISKQLESNQSIKLYL
jgi:hypothetical protein